MALVQQPVAGPGALGVDAEQLAPLEDPLRGGERPLPRVAAGAVDRDHAEGGEEPAGLPVVHVLGLADVGDPAWQDQGDEEGVEHRDVVRSDDRPAGGRDVLDALDRHLPEEAERRREHDAREGLDLPRISLALLGRHFVPPPDWREL